MEKLLNKRIKIAPAPKVPGSVDEVLHDLALNPKQSYLSAAISSQMRKFMEVLINIQNLKHIRCHFLHVQVAIC